MLNQDFLDDLEDDAPDDQKMNDEQEEAIKEFQQMYGSSILLKEEQFQQHFEKVQKYLSKIIDESTQINVGHEEYGLILKSNDYGSIINREIFAVQKQLKDIYKLRFPELEQIVLNPVDYTRIVKLIDRTIELQSVDLSSILTGHHLMAVNVAASSTSGLPLSEENYNRVNALCEEILKLDFYHIELLRYIESRMKFIAPNLSSLVGTQLASKLMTTAGGVEKLSQMPACNIQVMGGQKKTMLGFGSGMQDRNRGLFATLDMVQKAPAKFQTQLIRMLSTNVAKAARIDAQRTCLSGSEGERIKEKMLQRFEKIQEPPPPKLNKPLEPPDERPKKKRGGKRHRKDKDRLAQTELRKYQNRLQFGTEAEAEVRDTGIGIGMLSQGIGKIKVAIKKQKVTLTKKQQHRLNQQSSSAHTGGLTSSIAFTPVQGMELVNPDFKPAAQKPLSYFNRESGFRTVLQERKD